ncbi:hypothetical protein F5H01DRAFT_190567 [Linnemannia elongata]|nr:hypothetical protein F5H01DRAFT_190567 [Linnemannia elongata]
MGNIPHSSAVKISYFRRTMGWIDILLIVPVLLLARTACCPCISHVNSSNHALVSTSFRIYPHRIHPIHLENHLALRERERERESEEHRDCTHYDWTGYT